MRQVGAMEAIDKAARFWDRWAERYSRTPIKDEEAYERKLAMTRDHLQSTDKVLELGCGTGGTAIRHAPYVGEVHAVDFSPRMIDIARERAAQAEVSNASFEVASLDSLQAGNDAFDAILALSFLHLLEDPDVALQKIAALLRPGGVFVSSTACLAEHHGFLRLLGPIGRALGLLPVLSFFSFDGLRERIEAAGFEVLTFWVPEARRPHVAFVIAKKRS